MKRDKIKAPSCSHWLIDQVLVIETVKNTNSMNILEGAVFMTSIKRNNFHQQYLFDSSLSASESVHQINPNVGKTASEPDWTLTF